MTGYRSDRTARRPSRSLRRTVALAAAALAAGLLVTTVGTTTARAASRNLTELDGTVGPGYTITLKRDGRLVRSLRAGTYLFVISDRSALHDFTLEGPGRPPRVLTGDGFTGSRKVRLALKAGVYEYLCVVHEQIMHRTFKVR